jgi:hypothetical protein
VQPIYELGYQDTRIIHVSGYYAEKGKTVTQIRMRSQLGFTVYGVQLRIVKSLPSVPHYRLLADSNFDVMSHIWEKLSPSNILIVSRRLSTRPTVLYEMETRLLQAFICSTSSTSWLGYICRSCRYNRKT